MTPLLPSPLPLCESPPPLQTGLAGRNCDHLGITGPTTLPQGHVVPHSATEAAAPLGCPHFTLCKVAAQALPSGVLRRSHQTRGSARVLEGTLCVTESTAACSAVIGLCPLLSPRWLPATVSPRQGTAATGPLDIVTQLWVIREFNSVYMASEPGNGAWCFLFY